MYFRGSHRAVSLCNQPVLLYPPNGGRWLCSGTYKSSDAMSRESSRELVSYRVEAFILCS